MQNVYPKAEEKIGSHAEMEALYADRIVECMKAGVEKPHARPFVLGFRFKDPNMNEPYSALWTEIEEEGKRFRAVNPADYRTTKSYLEKLLSINKWLSPKAFLEGLMAEKDVKSWLMLKRKCKG